MNKSCLVYSAPDFTQEALFPGLTKNLQETSISMEFLIPFDEQKTIELCIEAQVQGTRLLGVGVTIRGVNSPGRKFNHRKLLGSLSA
jgi:hypothetical protein